MSGQPPRTPPTGPQGWSPWVDIGIGLFMCFGSVFLFFYLAHQEATGEAFSMNAIAVLLYNVGGKWLLSGLAAVIGVTCLFFGVKRLRNSDR
jgi:hypothetical protein